MCLFRLLDWVNFMLHMLHWKGFSPVCVLMWLFRWPESVNFLLQPSHVHSNGFSPVWILMCLSRIEPLVKTFSQMEQICAFPIFRGSAKSA